MLQAAADQLVAEHRKRSEKAGGRELRAVR